LALDESKETDEVFTKEGLTFVVDKGFFADAKPIKVDFSPMGFTVSSSIKLQKGGGCGGCGGGSECGS
jgi:hypothetical protein